MGFKKLMMEVFGLEHLMECIVMMEIPLKISNSVNINLYIFSSQGTYKMNYKISTAVNNAFR